MSLYLCTYLHIFSVDRSEHMIKPGAKFFFHFVYRQEGISGYMLSLPWKSKLSIAIKKKKKTIFAIFL